MDDVERRLRLGESADISNDDHAEDEQVELRATSTRNITHESQPEDPGSKVFIMISIESRRHFEVILVISMKHPIYFIVTSFVASATITVLTTLRP